MFVLASPTLVKNGAEFPMIVYYLGEVNVIKDEIIKFLVVTLTVNDGGA